MNEYAIEHLEILNALLIKIKGTIDHENFPEIYDSVLAHPDFKKGINLVWNGTSAQIKHIRLKEMESIYTRVKDSEQQRGDSHSALVFARGENYEKACLFKAAFAANLSIRYEVFSNLSEAKYWLQTLQEFQHGEPPAT